MLRITLQAGVSAETTGLTEAGYNRFPCREEVSEERIRPDGSCFVAKSTSQSSKPGSYRGMRIA